MLCVCLLSLSYSSEVYAGLMLTLLKVNGSVKYIYKKSRCDTASHKFAQVNLDYKQNKRQTITEKKKNARPKAHTHSYSGRNLHSLVTGLSKVLNGVRTRTCHTRPALSGKVCITFPIGHFSVGNA